MDDKLDKTQRILRSSKVTTDDRGRTVWVDPIETAKLELVSTQMLKQLVESGNDATNDQLRKIAEGKDGLLARDIDNGEFEIISDEELQKILDGTDAETEAAGKPQFMEEPQVEAAPDEAELELVSTQMLRVVLDPDAADIAIEEDADDAGFNPYDHS